MRNVLLYFPHAVYRPVLVVLVVAGLGSVALGQTIKSQKGNQGENASVPVVVFDGENIKCSDLNDLHEGGVGDIRFSHIITDDELKLNFADPNGTFPFTNNPAPFERIVVGPQNPAKSVTVASSSNPGLVSSWSSQLPITAVVVKVGNTSYVYPYKPFANSDTNLATGDNRGISHLTFCFGEETGTTAADASISGRVVNAFGIGIAKAQIVMINGATGEARLTMTNPFGYYSIPGVETGEMYVLNVRHKRYSFVENQRVVMLTDNLTELNFIAQQE
ncbi:MAG: carboxypeptidase-like regulatory domain-containing protein [Pyrinomonadaceae bacterium]